MNFFGLGNPNDPYAAYRSQADIYGNSFANPMNPANMNPGFGLDPNLLTPSYDAGYRPQYTGPQPYGQYGRVGFFGGLNSFVNPMDGDPRYGNPIDNQRQSVEGVSSRPFDSVVWAGHRIAAPAIAYGTAFSMFARPGMAAGNMLGRGLARGFSAGMGRYMPGWLGRGLEGALGGVGRVPGALGVAGYLAAPLIAGTAMMQAVQSGIVNPYINTRLAARNLRDNFAGVTFSDATGNSVTGQGLGYRESTSIAQSLIRQGNRDMMFSSGEYTNIADYSARAGLLDDTKSKQIAQRVKDIAAQVKLVMAIASDPSVKNAIEDLAKLHGAGASLIGGTSSQAANALVGIGQSAAVAGRSVQNIMKTVGAQGQYLFQANGMTPYLGQMAAANVLGSFEVAKRNGLLNTSQLARMGGTEGATQASLTGQINATQTLYNKMALFNKYLGGRTGSAAAGPGMRPTDVISQFGSDFSSDPMGSYGKMLMYSQMLGGKQLEAEGSLATENQVASVLDSMAVPKNADGTYDAAQMMPVLVNMIGMSPDEARAFISQRASETDQGTYRQGVRARNAQTSKQIRQYVSQNYLYGGAFGSTVRGARKGWNNFKNTLNRTFVEPFTDAQGFFGDEVQTGVDRLQFGSSISKDGSVSDLNSFVDAITSKNPVDSGPRKVTLLNSRPTEYSPKQLGKDIGRAWDAMSNSGVMSARDTRKIIARINDLAQGSGPSAKAAQDFINAKSPDGRSKALGSLLKTPEMADVAPMLNGTGQSDAARGNFGNFVQDTLDYGTNDQTISGNAPTGIKKAINQALGTGDKTVQLSFLDSLNAIGQASDLAGKINAGASQQDIQDILDKDNGNYAELKKLLGGRKGKDAADYIVHSYKGAVENGLGQIGGLAFNGNFSVDAYKLDPSRIKDKGLREKFIQAMKAGDTETMQNIIAKDLGLHNDGKFSDQGLKGAQKLDLNDVVGYQQQLDQNALSNSKSLDLIQSGRFDYATTQAMMNQLDTKKNNEAFGRAVDKFDKAADKIVNGGDSGQSNGGGSWWNPFSGPKPPSTMAPNNQRPGGSPQG